MQANSTSNESSVGSFRSERLGDGEPVKLYRVPDGTLALDDALELPKEPAKSSALGSWDGKSSGEAPDVLKGSPMMLPGSILKSQSSLGVRVAKDDGTSSSEEAAATNEGVEPEMASCPVLRRDRRTRTAPVFTSSDIDNIAGNLSRELLPPPGLRAPPGIPSHGSGLHSIGACRPCAWHWKQGGCKNGVECMRCHLCPEGETKSRKKTKVACLRLGLATPEQATEGGAEYLPAFVPSPFHSTLNADADWGSTTCTSSTQELTSGPSSEDDAPVGSETIQELKKEDPLAFPPGIAQTSEDPDEDGGSQSETEGMASCPVGILQRRVRRARTEPINLRWATYEDFSETNTEDKDSVLASPPGLQPLHGTPSVGSALHGTGECRPCAWFWKPGSCQNGSGCMHCHLCPEGEVKNRKKAKLTLLRLSPSPP
jgi:hypothetical protein